MAWKLAYQLRSKPDPSFTFNPNAAKRIVPWPIAACLAFPSHPGPSRLHRPCPSMVTHAFETSMPTVLLPRQLVGTPGGRSSWYSIRRILALSRTSSILMASGPAFRPCRAQQQLGGALSVQPQHGPRQLSAWHRLPSPRGFENAADRYPSLECDAFGNRGGGRIADFRHSHAQCRRNQPRLKRRFPSRSRHPFIRVWTGEVLKSIARARRCVTVLIGPNLNSHPVQI